MEFLIPPPPSVECQHPKVAVGGGTGNERRRNKQWISRILDAERDGVRFLLQGHEGRLLTMDGAGNGRC